MADDFDKQFPGWRDQRRINPEAQRALDEQCGWPAVAAPPVRRNDDVYAEIRSRDE